MGFVNSVKKDGMDTSNTRGYNCYLFGHIYAVVVNWW